MQGRGNVIVIAATNRPDKVDEALLRAGRFDRLLYVPPPDKSARVSILRVHTRKTPLAEDVDLGQMADQMHGQAQISSCMLISGAHAVYESNTVVDEAISQRKLIVDRQAYQRFPCILSLFCQ